MQKKTTLIVFALASVVFSYAQKPSSTTLSIQFGIQPVVDVPKNPVTVAPSLESALDPLTAEEALAITSKAKTPELGEQALAKARAERKAELASTYLKIDRPEYYKPGTVGSSDWTISLVTGDMTLAKVNEKPIGELEMSDPIFTYNFSAKLIVTDKAGTTIFEKVLVDPAVEQSMPKAILYFNLMYKMKAGLAKNNPEKLKKINDQMVEKKGHLILMQTLRQAKKALADGFEVQIRKVDVTVFSVKGKGYDELSAESDKIFKAWGNMHALSKKNRIPKSDVDKAMIDAVPVWEKYVAEHKELEENATKGLILNCALAYIFSGDFEKADKYLAQVPEAAKAGVKAEDKGEDGPPTTTSMGAVVFLTFQQSAENLRDLYNNLKEFKTRLTID